MIPDRDREAAIRAAIEGRLRVGVVVAREWHEEPDGTRWRIDNERGDMTVIPRGTVPWIDVVMEVKP